MNTIHTTCRSSGFILLLALCLAGPSQQARAQDANVTQSLNLQAGWNAIWLEVQPTNTDIGTVFEGLPVSTVWARVDPVSSVQFIEDPSEENLNVPGWLVWFPPGRPESDLNLSTLRAMLVNHAYLVNLTNAATLNLTGRPRVSKINWVPDAYSLRGFAVDPAGLPTFRNFFKYSPGQYNPVTRRLHSAFRLDAGGQWTLVNATDTMRSGEALWVYTVGVSDYTAPFELGLDGQRDLDFGSRVSSFTVQFRNRTTNTAVYTINDLSAPAELPLARHELNLSNAVVSWPDFATPYLLTNGTGANQDLRLAVRRASFSGKFTTVLQMTDGAGTRWRVPVLAEGDDSYAGLWVGSASITGVSEVNSGTLVTNVQWLTNELTGGVIVNSNAVMRTGVSTTPTPTPAAFDLRLLIHVNTNGTVRLLNQVLQMWQNGTTTNDGSGYLVTDQPGHYVLLTKDELIPTFQGASLRNGVSVGRRLSAPDFAFSNQETDNTLALTGTFAPGDTLAGAITLEPAHPTNPFLHRYHPDHDNLDAAFQPKDEAFRITRDLSLAISTTNITGRAIADYGYSELGGVYTEVVNGLTKEPIYLEGTFQLQRVAGSSPVLNQ